MRQYMSGEAARRFVLAAFIVSGLTIPVSAVAQSRSAEATIDSLVKIAVARNADLTAANARVDGTRNRIAPAGARPDPMLMLGVLNVPVLSPSFTDDDMTMK